MNNIRRIFDESRDAGQFAGGYLKYLSKLLERLDTEAIAAFIDEMEEARRNHSTVFFAGNGGSAATASHMAGDFGLGTRTRDGEPPFRALSLTDNLSCMTAIANDDGYENVFVYQLRVHYRPGDTLVAISASGNSPNVVAAAEWVKARGGSVIGLIGFDGGRLKNLCNLALHVETPKGEYGPVEDIHMILNHLMSCWLQCRERDRRSR